MKIAVEETSAVIVLDKKDSFQLFLPGTMEYNEAPPNVKTAVVLCSMLFNKDKELSTLLKDRGEYYYEKYFDSVIKEK